MTKTSIINFFRNEFGFAQEKDIYKVYRLYLLIGSFFATIIAFVFYKDNTVRFLLFDLLVVFSFIALLVFSFLSESVKRNLKYYFFVLCLFNSFYAFNNLYFSNYNVNDFIGFSLAYFSISIGILDHRLTFIYMVIMSVLVGTFGMISPGGEVSSTNILFLLVIVGIVSYIIHYNRYILLIKLIENKNELENNRDRLLTVLDSIDHVVYNVSIGSKGERTLRYVSNKVQDVLGLSIDEFFTAIKSGRIADRIHPDDLPAVYEKSHVLLSQKIPVSLNYRYKKGEDYIWIEEKVFPKLDENGNHIASIGISSDVTDRVHNQTELVNSEERYRTTIERNLAGFYRIDLNNILIDCNNAFANIFGFDKKEEIINKSVNNLYLDSTDKNRFIDRLTEQPIIINHESEITLKSGKKIWLLENVSMIFNKADEPIYIEGTAFDITEFKAALLKVESVESNLELVINNIDSLVYSLDISENGDKTFNFLGPQIESIIGLNRDKYIQEVKQNTISSYFHPDDLVKVRQNLRDLKTERKKGQFTYRFFNPEKQEYVWLEETMFPQFNDEGKIYKNFGVVRDVSERIKYQNALLQSEETYRTLFERNLAGVFKTTVKGKILDCNEAFVKIFGYNSKEELLKISSNELYHTLEDRENYINALSKNNFITNYEIRVKKKDGETAWILANVSKLYDEFINEDILIGTLVEITELKLTSEALLENENKFRSLFEFANDSIILYEYNQIIDCNDRTVEMFGFKKDEIIGKNLLDLSPDFQPDGKPSSEKIKQKFEAINPSKGLFFYWKNKTKSNIEFDSEYSVNTFHLGQRVITQIIIRDITARMKAENALRESEERFKLLANATIEGIVFSDETIIIDCNEQFALLHGYASRSEILGKSIFDFIHPDDKELLKERLLVNNPETIEIRSIKKDGSIMWLDSKGKYLPQGNKLIRVSVVYDITQRILFERELINSKKAYEQLVEESPYGIFIHRDGDIIYANNAAYEIVGADKSKMANKKISMYDYMLKDYVKESYVRRELVLKGQSVPFIRIQIKDLFGRELDIETKSQLIYYNDEKVIQTTFKNITAELQLEKEKIRAEVAEMSNKQLEIEIQEHKKTQEKLLEIQQYTQSIIGSSIDMIMATDIGENLSEMNPAAENTFGYKKEELIGKEPSILYGSKIDYNKVKKSLEETGNFTGEILNRRKNGELFTSYISASLLKNNKGEVVGTMGVSRDITEIIEAEKIVKDQNAKIKSIFENTSNILIWTIDRNYRITSFNKNFKETIQKYFAVDISIDINFMQELERIIHPSIFLKSKEKYNEAFNGKAQEMEGKLVSKDGKELWFETFLNPIVTDFTEIEEISCVSHEITEKKTALLELRKSEEQNKAIIDALPDIIYRVNTKGEFLDVIFKQQSRNQTINTGEIIGKRIPDLYEEEVADRFLKNIKSVLEFEQTMASEFEVRLENKTNYFEARFAKINQNEILLIIRDITENKESEQALLNSLKEKEVLLKEVHHRVKNNLQVISSILNLQSSYVKEESTLQILQESQNRIKSMSFIHESLYQTKNFSYINFSEYILNLSKNLLHSYQVFEDLVELKFDIVDLTINLDQCIPCGLIVNELLSNALKYAFEEGKKGLITITLAENNGIVSLGVEDNGIGLPEGFDPNTTETLGLQLVITLTEQLDGQMKLESKAGKGTKYLITFEKQN